MDTDLQWLSAVETRDGIASGRYSAGEVVAACLKRIARINPRLRAFVAVDGEGAMAAAAAADAAQAAGRSLGPLHGVPVAVKDDLWVAGMPATCGSLLFANFRPTRDGTLVERLKAAGAIVVGKTNMPEFAAWPRSKSYLAGEAANPWDPSRIPGASSGGSSAAVASGMVPVAIGTDGGGSIRIPASLTGIVGLFPTVGRVPAFGGFCCSPTESAGPMARTVTDAALVQQVIAGPDPRSAHGMATPAPDVLAGLDQGVAGMWIAWSDDHGRIPVDPAVLRVARGALDALRGGGALVTETDAAIPHPWGDGQAMAGLHAAVAAAGDPPPPQVSPPEQEDAESWLAESSATGELLFLLPRFQALIGANLDLVTPPHLASMRMPPAMGQGPTEAEMRAPMDRLLAGHDVLCCPTMATIAPVAPPGWASAYANCFMGTDFTFIANALRLPAITVPCGLAGGLPVGFQIIGRSGDEATVLRVARALEQRLAPLAYPQL